MSTKLFFILFFVALVKAERKNYDGYKLLKIKLPSQEHLEIFNSLFKSNPVDVWSNEGTLGKDNTILVSPAQYNTIQMYQKLLKSNDISVINNNIQQLINQEQVENSSKNSSKMDFFKAYHRYDEIVDFVRNLIQEHPLMIREIPNFGKSVQGRNVFGIIIQSPTAVSVSSKKNIFISSLQHAREWIAPAVPIYFIKKFIEDYKAGNVQVREILDQGVQIHVIPILNPDGYEYTHTNDRLWRKNRKHNGGNVYGVDINRNWPYKWGGPGASRNPRDQTYMGPSAASEIETQNLIRYAKSMSFIGALDFHSYSELLLRPWQWARHASSDEGPLRDIYGLQMQRLIQERDGKRYANIRGSELYVHSGALVDFWYGEIGVPCFTVELRPDRFSRYGFVLPPSYIEVVVEENYPAVVSFIQNSLKNPLR